jgi:hypothetical protein
MLQQKTTAWSRKGATITGNDDLPNVDEAWLAKSCQPSDVYRETHIGGFLPAWQGLPVVKDLIAQARNDTDESITRVAMSELTISFIPITEIVFDLGERARAAPQVKGQASQPPPSTVVNTYSMYIYGFQRKIPNDWRFLNWDRVWVGLLGIAVAALLLMIIVLVITRGM